MGNYILQRDLENRLTPAVLENLTGKTGNELAGLLDGVIARAEGFVNNYACVRYRVPLPEDPLITEWTLRIAEYELYKRGPGGNVPEKIRDSYKECITFLNDLAKGKFRLAGDPPKPSGAGVSVSVAPAGGRQPLFSAEAMKDF